MTICIVCPTRQAFWKGLCIRCHLWLGYEGRKRVTSDIELRRAVDRLRVHYSTVKAFGGGRH